MSLNGDYRTRLMIREALIKSDQESVISDQE